MPLKTLFLNPPSFENYDGGASSRWPATREIESYWYPVWLAYPAGMLEGSRMLDAPPHHISAEETIEIGKSFDFLVLFTSTPGFPGDIKLAARMKEANPNLKVCFVGPHVTTLPEKSLADGRSHRFHRAPRVRLRHRGIRQRQAAERNPGCVVPWTQRHRDSQSRSSGRV